MGVIEREKARAAYDQILGGHLLVSHELPTKICEICTGVTLADGAALWVFNSALTGADLDCRDEKGICQLEGIFTDNSAIPGKLSFAAPQPRSSGSVSDYVCLTRNIAYVPDVNSWSQEVAGKRFQVFIKDDLIKHGLSGLVAIPIVSDTHADKSNGEVTGALTLFYRELGLDPLDDTDREILLLLGKMTYLAFAHRNLYRQHDAAKDLSELAGKHLTRYNDRPLKVRQDYLDELLKVVAKHMAAKAVSVFWRDLFSPKIIKCLASTGLTDHRAPQAHYFTRDEIARVEYDVERDSSNLTVITYRDRKVFNTDPTYRFSQEWRYKFTEIVNTQSTGDAVIDSSTLFPIGKTDDGSAMGVLRCKYPVASHGAPWPRCFDSVQMTIGRFVADQVSPILHTFEQRILRESAIAVVRHDLSAPLVGIRDAIDWLEDHPEDFSNPNSFYRANLRQCTLGLGHLQSLLAVDYNFSAHNLRKSRVQMESEILAPMKRIMYPYAQETAHMTIRYEGAAALPAMNIDRELVTRAVYNLITNAVKYGISGTQITIRGRTLEDGYALDVENQGLPISPRDAQMIFEPYFRGRTSYQREGSGLGLTIARLIMRAHGGTAELVQEQHPVIFRLKFPKSAAILS